MPPAYVRTADDLLSLVTVGVTTESLFLDFKLQVDASQADWQNEVAQDVCQFANAEGGCLLIGVAESKDERTGLKVAAVFKGVAEPDRVRGWIETAIANKVVPPTLSRTIEFVKLPTATVVAVNIPPSRRLAYVWEGGPETITCAYRTNHGKARMNPDEMERHMMNGSRAAMLGFREARARASEERVEVHGGVWAHGYSQANLTFLQPSLKGTITGVEEMLFQVKATVHGESVGLGGGDYTVNIPFDVLRSVWVDPNGHLAVLLSVRLVLGLDRNLILEPS